MNKNLVVHNQIARMEVLGNNDLDILYVSDSFYKTLGIEKDDLKNIYNNKFLNIINNNDKQKVAELILSSSDEDKFFDIVININGSEIYLAIFSFIKEASINNLNGLNSLHLTISDKTAHVNSYNKKLKELEAEKNIDYLTSAYTKSATEKLINLLLEANPNHNYALCIVDLDYFKKVNDTFGHLFGDRVLKDFVKSIVNTLDNSISAEFDINNTKSLLGRIGGDEFILLLRYDNINFIKQKMENIAHNIKNIYIADESTHKITASIGIALSPTHGDTFSELMEKADISLYNVKYNGRNDYKIYDDNLKKLDALTKKSPISLKTKFNKLEHIFDIINFYINTKDFNVAIQIVVETICKVYKFDRTCIFIKNNLDDQLNCLYEYNVNYFWKNHNDDDAKLEKNLYDICLNNQHSIYNDLLPEIFENKKYIYTDNLDKDYLNEFHSIGFQKNKNFDVNEFYAYYFTNSTFVTGYLTFEKYNFSETITDVQIVELNTICALINDKINENFTKRKLVNEISIYKSVLSDSTVKIAVIKKNTYEVLYFNSLFKEICPDFEFGEVCRLGKNRQQIEEYFYNLNEDFNVECTSITWENELDAFIVCIRDKITANIGHDLNNMVNIDLLTNSPTLDKFKLDFNTSIKHNLLETPSINKNNNSNLFYSMLVFDIEKFNYINNVFGYIIGDEILKKISNSLKNFLRLDELYCRVKDDKFALILSYQDKSEFELRVKYLNDLLLELKKLYFKDIPLIIVCGIYHITDYALADSNNLNTSNSTNFKLDLDIDSILSKANLARKSAKGSEVTKNIFKPYSSTLDNFTKKQSFVDEKIERSLKNKEFIAYLQPKFNLYSNELSGAEALVRWKFEDRIIYPSEFVNIFEEKGLIAEIDFIMYNKVFEYISSCLKRGIPIVPISLNVSKIHIEDTNFIEKLIALSSTYNVPFELIEIEITEQVFIECNYLIKNFIKNLINIGIKVSIDNFGTAYASLNALKELEISMVKMDKGILQTVEQIKNNENLLNRDKIIIKHIVGMCKALNINVICEGIETLEQMRFLKNIGCEYGQGYIFSKPIPIEEFEENFLI
ncbi:MAG: EAL domain-containing protein [bacterium]